MFAVFSKISGHLTNAMGAAAWTFRSALDANNILMEVFGNLFQKSLDIVTKVAVQLRSAVCRSVEDMGSFLMDVCATTNFVVDSFVQGILLVCNALNTVCLFLVRCMVTVTGCIDGFACVICFSMEAVSGVIVWTAVSFWKALTLIGYSVVFLLGTIPKAIVAGLDLLVYGVVEGVWGTQRAVVESFQTSVRLATFVGRWTALTIYAIPLDAYFGLVLLCLTHFGVHYLLKSRHVRRSIWRFVGCIKRMRRNWTQLDTWRLCGVRFRRWFIRAPQLEVAARNVALNEEVVDPSPEWRLVRHTMAQNGRNAVYQPQPMSRRSQTPPTPPPNMQAEISRLKLQLSMEKDIRRCVVCQDRDKCITLLPCGHLCLCAVCSEEIQETCPICRERIFEQLQIFT